MIVRGAPWLMLAALVLAPACTGLGDRPPPRILEFGAHRMQVTVPTGWDLLDHGKQKRFRKGEFEIVLEHLESPPEKSQVPSDPADRALTAIGHDPRRRDVKSRRPTTRDGRESFDIETWNRLDHTNPQKVSLVIDDDDLFVLYTVRMADGDTLEAFDSIRASLHFVTTARR